MAQLRKGIEKAEAPPKKKANPAQPPPPKVAHTAGSLLPARELCFDVCCALPRHPLRNGGTLQLARTEECRAAASQLLCPVVDSGAGVQRQLWCLQCCDSTGSSSRAVQCRRDWRGGRLSQIWRLQVTRADVYVSLRYGGWQEATLRYLAEQFDAGARAFPAAAMAGAVDAVKASGTAQGVPDKALKQTVIPFAKLKMSEAQSGGVQVRAYVVLLQAPHAHAISLGFNGGGWQACARFPQHDAHCASCLL